MNAMNEIMAFIPIYKYTPLHNYSQHTQPKSVMKITSEEALRGLINIFNINGSRVELYSKLKSQIYSPALQQYFQKQVDESNMILEELNPIIDSSLEASENPVAFEDAILHQSQFYFGLACASNNPRTVLVSCQFGNEMLIKAYQKILIFLDNNAMNSIWVMVSKHLESIKNTYMDYEKNAMNEMIRLA
jgi:hypothetical protein